MLRHKKWELKCIALEKSSWNSSPITMSLLTTYYLGIPAITMDEQKKLTVKVHYSPTNAQVTALKTILKFTLL